ncbi:MULTISPECIES: hypothetical protein [unclassified Legionella]|uniref:hypothetical protein n=1 Tax=unclassified Legionella TaxID=2622702 RepID=UPI00105683FF|nr:MULTISPECIES: hypothetical protein [unclassified Legionella]MDI9819731.1 hypothetical protein [Legionella sp. PL877]
MGFALSLLLKEMRKKFPLSDQTLEISPEVLKNIKQIQKICNKDYFNQSFYGSAALNRKILLDKRIADLLTPETITGILSIHASTTNLPKSQIGIWRNSSGYISFAAALFYGFNEGLDTIQLMPNNEPQYSSEQYQDQKKRFEENTKRIINNIKQAAMELGISTEDERFQLKAEKNQPLSELFQSIEDTIGSLKRDNKGDALLFVPTYTPDDIRQQSIYGFKTICSILKINYSIHLNAIVIDPPTTIDHFISQFLSSEEALLDGKVIHLFYDRAHLEACIEQDTKIIFQNKEYYLRDILREMIKKCETSEAVSKTAKEQFDIRLKLCDAHLRASFSSYCKQESHPSKKSEEAAFPSGYKEIKKLLSKIETEIDKALWNYGNLGSLYAERDFLRKIIEIYDDTNGNLPLKKCLVLAKWHHPEGFKQVSDHRGVNFFFNVLDKKIPQNPTQGPRLKNNASITLEKLLHTLLTDYKSIECSYNALDELEITIDSIYFNVTQILLNDPDFEHITFTDEHLGKYADFVTQKALYKPQLAVNNNLIIPSPADYEQLDKEGICSHLHYAEKLGVTVYSSDFYSFIQSFLRTKGQSEHLQKTSPDELKKLIPEILLSTAIAAHGLSRTTLKNADTAHHEPSVNYRKEFTSPNFNFFKSRLESLRTKKPSFEKGFLSTSGNNSFKRDANTFTVFYEDEVSNTLGKKVEAISRYRSEKEFLYNPGTQLQYTDYYKHGNRHFFAVRPIRSIDGIKENTYSNQRLSKHELEIIDKMFEQHLINHKHSFFRRLFDTVSNGDKLNCIKQAKSEIKKTLDELKTQENLTTEQLGTCKAALEQAIETNKALVVKGFLPASLGKTDKILQEALLRVNRAIQLINPQESIMDKPLMT